MGIILTSSASISVSTPLSVNITKSEPPPALISDFYHNFTIKCIKCAMNTPIGYQAKGGYQLVTITYALIKSLPKPISHALINSSIGLSLTHITDQITH